MLWASNTKENPTVYLKQIDLRILLNSGSPPQIQEKREATCPQGDLRLVIDSLPYQLQEDSLSFHLVATSPPKIIKQALYSLSLNFSTRLAQSIGKEIALIEPNQAISKENYKLMKLLGLTKKNEPIVFYNGLIDFAPPGRIAFPESNPSVSPVLEFFVSNPIDQVCTCNLQYITTFLFWNAYYIAEMYSDKEVISFKGMLKIHNATGVSLNNASILWFPTSTQMPYTLASITLTPGDIQHVSFFSKEAPFVINYYMDLSKAKNQEGEKWPVQKRLKVDDISIKDIPNGSLTVYLRKAGGPPSYLNRHTVKKFSSTNLEFTIEDEPKIYAELYQIYSRSLSNNQQEVTYYIYLNNTMNKSIDVNLYRPLEKNYIFSQSSNTPVTQNTSEIVWKITLPPDQKQLFWYRMIIPSQPIQLPQPTVK